jgi:flagellum-specific peptidoglycan hydrolase FlgJ
MRPVRKPTLQQATALVSLSTCGAMTGFAFAHGTVGDMTSPTRMPVHLLALDKPAKPASTPDSALRAAIVKVATSYLQMAQTRTPAEMEAMIWGVDSLDGADHGESCAAFASLTLALGAQAVGQQSWATGGSSYPWPLHQWADVRVDPNPDSLQIVSVLQDAQAHNRWHPLGDGYQPQPGDWVLFDGHVEVVTSYSGGVLNTIGGDSGANLSVNAHSYPAPLAAQGVDGFVDNGDLASAAGPAAAGASAAASGRPAAAGSAAGGSAAGGSAAGGAAAQAEMAGVLGPGLASVDMASTGGAAVPGTGTAAARKGTTRMVGTAGRGGTVGTNSMVAVPGMMAGVGLAASNGSAGLDGNGRGNGPGGSGGIAPGSGTAAAVNAAGGGSTGGTAKTGRNGNPARPGTVRAPRAGQGGKAGSAAIPGLQPLADNPSGADAAPAAPSYTRNTAPAATNFPGTAAQQGFISQIAPGAMAAQSRYGIPAAVTIAQAIDESGWGQSVLAIRDHNLFGIKGSGPAGSDMLPTQEFENGQWVTITAPFRVYHNVAESIADHSQLLATGSAYQQAMADRNLPDAFANDLTGVYATDPQYGSNLIAIMRLYNLYQYDSTSQGSGAAAAPAVTPSPAATTPGPAATPSPGAAGGQDGGHGAMATIPGLLDAYTVGPARSVTAPRQAPPPAKPSQRPRVAPRGAGASVRAGRYVPQIPRTVTTAFITSAKAPLGRAKPLYDDVASRTGIRWELLAACDWMQCKAQPRLSPVYGERLGAVNADGTVYRTKSSALDQVANELVELAMAVYWIDITARRPLSVRHLAQVFAAFRWGGLLKLHGISAMEFPYSVAGLTAQHVKMRWPDIKDRDAPDKPGTRFRLPFGAVPTVLCLGYPALA